MSANKKVDCFAGYQRTAEKMAAFTSAVNHLDLSQFTEEQLQAMLDACDHARSSYAEEANTAELQKLREDLERIERKQDENQKAQAMDTQKAYNISLIALGLNALAIVVAVIIALLS